MTKQTILLIIFLLFSFSGNAQKNMKRDKAKNRDIIFVTNKQTTPYQCDTPIFDLGIALSGGGGRGFAHAGALKAIEEYELKPEIVAGTSVGSIAGAMYAAGVSPDSMLSLFSTIRFFQVPTPKLFKKNGTTDKMHRSHIVMKIQDLEKIISNVLPVKTFEELKIPLVVNATNITSAQNIFFTQGDLIRPIIASSAVPIFFKPVEIDGALYSDGGVMQNLPVSPIRKACKYIIAIDLNPIEDFSSTGEIHEGELERTFKLMIKGNSMNDMMDADLYILPAELIHYKLYDTKHGKEMFEIGYQSAKRQLKEFVAQHPELVKQQ